MKNFHQRPSASLGFPRLRREASAEGRAGFRREAAEKMKNEKLIIQNTRIYLISIVIIMITAVCITAVIFNTRFAKVTIDVWSFGAALFLIIEALYKIIRTSDKFWPNQFLRIIRIIIGVCVFTIHVCQLIYGI